MTARNWLITGVSSGFGRELATQLLDRGDTVAGTVRRPDSVADLLRKYPGTFHRELLDVTHAAAVRDVVIRSFSSLGRIDVVVSNAGYGLFGAAEEPSDQQVSHIIATNLTGSIQLIRAALPHLRAQGGGRIIQISTYGGQVAFPGNSMYHATKWGIEGFAESVAQEVAPFGIGVTIVEPGGARTEFRYGSAQSGPVFLTERRAASHRVTAAADLDPETGRARLSYEMAEQIFKEHSGGKTLHRLRHFVPAQLSCREKNISAPMLMAISGHKRLSSLQQYVKPSQAAVAKLMADTDPDRRRR